MTPERRAPVGPQDVDALLAAAGGGSQVALARLLSLVERGGPASRRVAEIAYASPPPYSVGLTGAPGAGKSTLTDHLIAAARRGWPAVAPSELAAPDAEGAGPAARDAERAEPPDQTEPAARDVEPAEPIEPIDQIAVLAVDPSSPFSGGAILGDRIRMQDHATDPSVYIRSMATRGHLGGLALAVPDAVRLLGAVGKPVVLIETVGVGQMEVEVASAADTTVVVVNPGWGDAMQANKAGLLEVADIFVINKADRPGVAEAKRDLHQMLDLSGHVDWRPPIVETVAANGSGIAELWAQVAAHRAHLVDAGLLASRRAGRLEAELRRILLAELAARVADVASGPVFAEAMAAVVEGGLDPYRAADRVLAAHPGPGPDATAAPERRVRFAGG